MIIVESCVCVCVCIFYFIIIVLCCVGVMDLSWDVSFIKFELNWYVVYRARWFGLRLTDGCDIPKSSALQSCMYPVAKYRSVAKHFISGLIELFLLVGDVIASHTNSTSSFIPSRFSLSLDQFTIPLSPQYFVSQPFPDSLWIGLTELGVLERTFRLS